MLDDSLEEDVGETGSSNENSNDEYDDANISIQNLIQNEQEKMNFATLNHTIYSEEVLYKLCIACCVADCHHNLAIKIINVL